MPKGERLAYRCIRCGGFGVIQINSHYYQCISRDCEQVHELDDFGSTIKPFPPITFQEESQNERSKGD